MLTFETTLIAKNVKATEEKMEGTSITEIYPKVPNI